MPEQALAAAKAAEDAVMRGEPLGLLHGVPFSVKDLIAVGGGASRSARAAWPTTSRRPTRPSVERAQARPARS